MLEFATAPGDSPAEVEETAAVEETIESTENVVRVVAIQSEARVIDSAVVLRGETEATRQLDVMAETSGLVVSEPLRKGALVEAGQLLCEIDPGTRNASLAEAQARLASAKAATPAAQAVIPLKAVCVQSVLASGRTAISGRASPNLWQ